MASEIREGLLCEGWRVKWGLWKTEKERERENTRSCLSDADTAYTSSHSWENLRLISSALLIFCMCVSEPWLTLATCSLFMLSGGEG